MKSRFPFRSLSITLPFGGMIIRVLLILAIFIITGEGLIRGGIALGLWREPLFSTVNAELDIKIQSLDELNRVQPVDCLFLGSSQLDTAINPAEFETEFANHTGKDMHCYNFSLGTLTAGPAGKIARLLVTRYHPRILVVGISARDFSRDFGELARPLANDPWVLHSLGTPNPVGWLSENSRLFRFLSQIRTQFNPDYQEFRTGLIRSLASNGFLQRAGNDLSIDTPQFIPKFELYPDDLAGLDDLQSINNQSVQVIFLEVPVHPTFLPTYVEGDTANYFSLFRKPVAQLIEADGMVFIISQEDIGTYISNSGWNDVKHLNSTGAAIFSRWFARKIDESLIPPNVLSMNNHGNP